MKPLIFAATTALSLACGGAMAACPGTPLAGAAISTLLSGNTVCVGTPGNWEAQELHVAGGSLVDYKRGPGHAIDPSETVGSWAVNTTAGTVTHNYGSGGSYTYTMSANGGTSYSFCSTAGAPEIVANIKTGGGACP